MNRIDRSRSSKPIRQLGSTLVVALILLFIATVLALFATNVGLFAQRASGADVRARAIHQTLEAALSQGAEYIKNNRSTLVDPNNPTDSTYWTQCDAGDTSFPCGTVPSCAGDSGGTCAAGSANARRANMYYYSTTAGAGYNVDGTASGASTSNQINKNSLPIASTQRITSSNGYTVNYGVGALMCMVKSQASTYTGPAQCTTTATNAQGIYLFTITAVGNVSGESAASTLSMTFGSAPKIPGAVNAPTVVASSNLVVNGNTTFVTAPDAGGYGVPVTIWSRDYVRPQGAGNPDTCYFEDWIRNGSGTYQFESNSDGTTSKVVSCTGKGNAHCYCSQDISVGQGGLTYGSDILDNQANVSPANKQVPVCPTSYPNCKPNYDVQPSEFPCDLFQYIFGVQAWQDSTGNDNFCETRLPKVSQKMGDGTTQSVNVDEAYLYTNAALIYSTAHPLWPTSAQKVGSCTALVAATRATSFTGGIVWDQTGACDLSPTVGWPDKPVAWVSDGDLRGNIGTVFGLVFVRDTTDPGPTVVGGAVSISNNSQGTIYGSLVIQGGGTLNGSSAVIYNGNVMKALSNLNSTNPASQVPGTWTDRYGY